MQGKFSLGFLAGGRRRRSPHGTATDLLVQTQRIPFFNGYSIFSNGEILFAGPVDFFGCV